MARLGDVFSVIRNGASIKQTDGAGGLPITRIETISNREIDRNKFGYAGIKDIDKYHEYILQDGDILMSHINSEKHLGKVALYKKQGNEIIIHGMNLLMLRANEALVYPPFAAYYFETNMFLNQIQRITKKSVNQASFTVTALKEIEMPLLSLEEQRRIAALLDKVSDLIAKRRAQLDKLDLLVKARFVEVMENSQLGDKTTIENITQKVKVGFVGTCEQYYTDETGIPMIRTGNITEHGIDMTELKYVTTEFHKKNKKSQIQTGDLLIARHGSNGQANVYYGPVAQCLNAVIVVPDSQMATSIFLANLINSSAVREQIEKTLVGSTQRVINTKSIAKIVVRIPDLSVQRDFENTVLQIGRIALALRRGISQLETLKKALMQQYFG